MQKILVFCIPFIIMAVPLALIKSRIVVPSVFLILAIVIQIASKEHGSFSAAVFLMFAFSDMPKRWFIIPAAILFFFSIMANFAFIHHTIPDFSNIIALYAFIGVLYYKKFHPKRPRPVPHPLHDSEDIIIADRIAQGMTYKEIAFDLDIAESAIGTRVKRMREKYPAGTTTTKMILCLYNSGTIPIDRKKAT